MPGVSSVDVNVLTKSVVVRHRTGVGEGHCTSPADLLDALSGAKLQVSLDTKESLVARCPPLGCARAKKDVEIGAGSWEDGDGSDGGVGEQGGGGSGEAPARIMIGAALWLLSTTQYWLDDAHAALVGPDTRVAHTLEGGHLGTHLQVGSDEVSTGNIVTGVDELQGGGGGGPGAWRWLYICAGAIAVVLCAPPILSRAIGSLRMGVLDVNTLMGISVVGALALGDYSEAAAVAVLFAGSEWIEARTAKGILHAVLLLGMLPPLCVFCAPLNTCVCVFVCVCVLCVCVCACVCVWGIGGAYGQPPVVIPHNRPTPKLVGRMWGANGI